VWVCIYLKDHWADLTPYLHPLRASPPIFQYLFVFLRLQLSQATIFFSDSILFLSVTTHLSFVDILIVPFDSLITLNPILFPLFHALQALSEGIHFEILTSYLLRRYYQLLHQLFTFVSPDFELLPFLQEPIQVVS